MAEDSPELTTTEQYILSQLLVCGAVTQVEYENAVNDKFSRTVRENWLEQLEEKGLLQHTLYDNYGSTR